MNRRLTLVLFVVLGLCLLMAGVPHLMAQTADSTVASGGNADLGYGIEAYSKLISMALGSWLFAQWNKNRPKLDALSNLFKALVVTGLVTGLGLLGTFLHVAVSKDTADWGAAFWLSLASGGVTAVVGKIVLAMKKVQPSRGLGT